MAVEGEDAVWARRGGEGGGEVGRRGVRGQGIQVTGSECG